MNQVNQKTFICTEYPETMRYLSMKSPDNLFKWRKKFTYISGFLFKLKDFVNSLKY